MAESGSNHAGGMPALASLSLAAHAPLALPGTVAGRRAGRGRTGIAARPSNALAPAHPPSTIPEPRAEMHQVSPHQRNGLGRALVGVASGLGNLLFRPQNIALVPGALVGARVFPSMLRRKAAGGEKPSGAAAGRKPALVWFRTDLRLHDHDALAAANREGTSLLPVYVFDPREYGKSATGFDKTGPHRAQFILDAVSDLRARLRGAGSDLVVVQGQPEDVLPRLAAASGAGAVYYHTEVTHEEAQVEARVRAALEGEGVEAKGFWSGTLYHPDDLPFKLEGMPTNFADFKQRLGATAVRPVVQQPTSLKGMPAGSVDVGDIPSLPQLGFEAAATPGRTARSTSSGAASGARLGSGLQGGESEALRQVDLFMRELKSRAAPGVTAAPAAPANFSCRISPWLALGCLSPRQMFHELQSQAAALGLGAKGGADVLRPGSKASGSAPVGSPAGNATWLVFELLWRDFFRFVTKRYSAATAKTHAPALAAAV